MGRDSRSVKHWIPLSPEQELFWLYYRFTGDSLNIIFKIELEAGTDPAKVTESLNSVIAGHDIFWYQAAKYTARQYLGPVCRIDVKQGRFVLKNRLELDQVMEGMKAPFSLTGGPKVRAKLMRNLNASYTLYIATPHQVIDYMTVILINRLFMRQLNDGATPPTKAAPYAAYIAGCLAEEGREQRRENLQYWTDTLKNAGPFLLQRAYIPTGPDNLRSVHLRLSQEEYASLTAAAKQLGVPGTIFFYACVYTALHLLTGSPAFVFSFMFAVKRNGELADTLGPMIGLLPIRYIFLPEEGLKETIGQIYQMVKTAHKLKKFMPNIDLMSATPRLLTVLPVKYRFLSVFYNLCYRLVGKPMLSPQNVTGALYKIKALGLQAFTKQSSEPYEVMFNPRQSSDMKGASYSSWIEDETQSLGISSDDEATDYRPEGIYFTMNYDTGNFIELHSTPFINPGGQEKFLELLKTIFTQVSTEGSLALKDLATQP